jgi:hypothetical protein
MMPEIHLNDIVRLKKPHACGATEWEIVRLGADIGMVCQGCERKVMLTRRKLASRLKKIISRETEE